MVQPPSTGAEGMVFANPAKSAEQKQRYDLLTRTAVCMRLSGMHALSNAAMAKPVDEMLTAINTLAASGREVRLQNVRDCFFVDRQILDIDNDQVESVRMMRRVMRRLSINEIAFKNELSREELVSFLENYQKRIWTSDISTNNLHPKVALRILSKEQRESLLKQGDHRQDVIRTYVLTAMALRELVTRGNEGKPAKVSGIKRALQLLYDASADYPTILMGLTRFLNPEGRAYFHAVAVASIVLLMCRRIGIEKRTTADLMQQAALHDISRQTLTDPFDNSQLDENLVRQASRSLEMIPIRSIRRLCSSEMDPETLLRATAAVEVDWRLDAEDGFLPSWPSRIISVARAYQMLTLPPAPRRGMTPDCALRMILGHAGTRFDAVAAEVLAMSIGRCPIGTVAQLSSHEVGVVSGLPRDPAQVLHVPIRLFRAADGSPMSEDVDLADDPRQRTIVSIIDPHDIEANVSSVLVGDMSRPEDAAASAPQAAADTPAVPSAPSLELQDNLQSPLDFITSASPDAMSTVIATPTGSPEADAPPAPAFAAPQAPVTAVVAPSVAPPAGSPGAESPAPSLAGQRIMTGAFDLPPPGEFPTLMTASVPAFAALQAEQPAQPAPGQPVATGGLPSQPPAPGQRVPTGGLPSQPPATGQRVPTGGLPSQPPAAPDTFRAPSPATPGSLPAPETAAPLRPTTGAGGPAPDAFRAVVPSSSDLQRPAEAAGRRVPTTALPSRPAEAAGRRVPTTALPSTPAEAAGRRVPTTALPSTPAEAAGRRVPTTALPSRPAEAAGRRVPTTALPSRPAEAAGRRVPTTALPSRPAEAASPSASSASIPTPAAGRRVQTGVSSLPQTTPSSAPTAPPPSFPGRTVEKVSSPAPRPPPAMGQDGPPGPDGTDPTGSTSST